MNYKIDINNIIYKNKESPFDEELNSTNLLLEDNNNTQHKTKTFEDVLKETNFKFQNLIKTIVKKNSNNNFLDKIIKDIIHLQYIFKNKILDNNYINKIPDNIEIKNNFKNIEMTNNISYKYISQEETKDTYTNDINFKNIKNVQENINTNINLKNENILNYNKNSNSEKLENTNRLAGIKYNSKNNKLNPYLNNKDNNIRFICKKRNREEKDINSKNKKDIFIKIKELYNLYNKNIKNNNKNISIYQILEDNILFFKKNITIIENNIPICVIYFNHELI